ncbi:hypothetical protein C8F01DRAFT_1256875 [Mycena amicta]|nr:hypothetical protein C8F01DRAFT_1256875 [Mycena amicta]
MPDAGAMSIILDDTKLPQPISLDFEGNISQALYPSAYNNTIAMFEMKFSQAEFEWVVAFDGVSMQLYGVAPPLPIDQTFIISDDSVGYTEYSYHAPGYGGLHYYTSLANASLSKLALNLVLDQVVGFALDYVVVTVHPTTDLLGKTIIVDDDSSALIWRGAWTADNNFTLAVDCIMSLNSTNAQSFTAHMAPHANTTHASQTVGDEFEFWFTGTSIVVLAMAASDVFHTEPIMVNFTSQDPDSEVRYEQPHFVYFNASSIPAGNHSLVGGVVDVVGSTLPRARIDYLTYKPSFESQAKMPVLPPFAPTPTATSSTSSMSPTSSSVAGSGGSETAKTRINKGAVAGGAVGAVRRNRTLHQVYEPFSGSSASTSYHDIIPVGEKRGTMRLGNDTVTQEPRTDPQEPVHHDAGPPAAGTLSQPLVDTPAVHGDDAIEGLPPPQRNTEMLDSRVRELQTLVQQLTQEVREQVLPPAYDGAAV